MKNLILAILLIATTPNFAQKKIPNLKPIKDNYNRINAIKNWTKIDKKEVQESSEGGEIVYYYMNEKLEKIEEKQFGEMGRSVTEYYLLNGELSFFLDTYIQYEKPFEDKNAQKLTDRKYFVNQKLIHEISEQDQGSPFTNTKKAILEEQKRIIGQFNNLIKRSKIN